ncbi:G-alpha domain-containing protein [Rhizoctonia solani AG-1 IA]|uniref:G-alpha domain-containing protein n=1 Tax=Thanatephorus cucumeris (strain AG1-IA) TaxID=983506 RepID=L8WTD0_THACA|nr:G-alpha domain-containing protein [Rhizoctonia solani AG-1 IA]
MLPLGVLNYSHRISHPSLPAHRCLFDVGGARSQRAHWAPYFEDATAIVFLARKCPTRVLLFTSVIEPHPTRLAISAYDQYLEEDARTNRIDDSLQLWTQITSSPILKEVHLVLFLNKREACGWCQGQKIVSSLFQSRAFGIVELNCI